MPPKTLIVTDSHSGMHLDLVIACSSRIALDWKDICDIIIAEKSRLYTLRKGSLFDHENTYR